MADYDEEDFADQFAALCAQQADVPLSASPMWADLTPIPQDDGPNPVVPIAYSPEFVEAHNYFRAILKKDERSERAVKLTAYVITLNPANYTAWYFRRLCLFSLNSDLTQEVKFSDTIGRIHPKNYQLWHHRRVLLDKIGQPLDELANTASVLRGDAKNYHVWSHRQWLLKRFSIWEGELDYVESLLQADLRNNSAWNQRHFVVDHLPGGFSESRIAEELSYCTKYIDLAPNNESVWNYVRGMMLKPAFTHAATVEALCRRALQKDSKCAYAMGTLVDLYCRSKDKGQVREAVKICTELAQSVDTIRHRYWDFQKSNIEKALQS